MNQNFRKISILGGGLLGGSLALALQGKTDASLWLRKPTAIGAAREFGISQVTSELSHAVKEVDLLILAVPVGAMPMLLQAAIHAGLPSDCLVTDVGSVKKVPHDTLSPIVAKSGNPFIGSHPMAGSEQNGLSAARGNLFANATCLLTNDSGASDKLCERIELFWQSLGCRNHWFTAAEHDSLVARISHLPHLTAAATAAVSLKQISDGLFGGGGLRDTTRVAAGNPSMWAEIITENRAALVPALRETIDQLLEILASLEKADQERAQQWLAHAKALRDTLPPTA